MANYNISYATTVEKLYNISGIPASLINKEDLSTLYCFPSSVSHIFPTRIIEFVLKRIPLRKTVDGVRFVIHGQFDFFVGFIDLGNYLLSVGPVSPRDVSLRELMDQFTSFSRDELYRIYKACDLAPRADCHKFANLMSLYIELCFGKNIDQGNILYSCNITNLHDVEVNTISSDLTPGQVESILLFESQLMGIIMSGIQENVNRLGSIASPFMLTGENERILIHSIFVCMAQAATRGGANPNEIFNIYATGLERVNSTQNTYDYTAIVFDTASKLCELVRQSKYSYIKPDICNLAEKYITEHINEQIFIGDVAKYTGISERQLQRTFKSYYHCTVIKMINQEKLRQAAALLASSSFNVSEVAQHLGFTSQSYFSKIFLEQYGVTPSEYKLKKGAI